MQLWMDAKDPLLYERAKSLLRVRGRLAGRQLHVTSRQHKQRLYLSPSLCLLSPAAQNTVTAAHCDFRSSLILAAPVHTAAISWIILFVPLWRCAFFSPSSPVPVGVHKSLSSVCCLDERKDVIPLHGSIWRGNSPQRMDERCCGLTSYCGVFTQIILFSAWMSVTLLHLY